ncbi:MAG TPA: hypothetical protein VEG62_06660, partial [Acidimicrobiales bacterium]|nr:hypothetical protein [Acidimicrobiales bacterium]
MIAATLAALVPAPIPAAADQVQSLEARAASIAHDLVQEQLQVDAYQQQYSVASAKVAADTQSITAVDHQLGADQEQVTADTVDVRQLAVRSYMDGGADLSGPSVFQFAGAPESDQAASEYISIAATNFQSALDQLRTARDTLDKQEANLQEAQAVDRSNLERQAAFLAQASRTESSLTALHSEVTGQLATAVAQQDAIAAADAAAVVHAAWTSGPAQGASPSTGQSVP